MISKSKSKVIAKKYVLYAERNLWSSQYKEWKKFAVSKPRLPTDIDSSEKWVEKLYPLGLNYFVGKHNVDIVDSFKELAEGLCDGKFPNILVIHGPEGSGKSSLCSCFVKYLCETVNIPMGKLSKWAYKFDAAKDSFPDLKECIQQVFLLKDDSATAQAITVGFKIIIIDCMELITPSQQQELKKLIESATGKLKFIFICNKPNSLIGYIQSRAMLLKTKSINEKDALNLILSICYRFKIGFEREGAIIYIKIIAIAKLDLISKVFKSCSSIISRLIYEKNIFIRVV
jgi:replication-associated recombination protein RarA